jgi:acetyl-CoA carboxylase alpha subunit
MTSAFQMSVLSCVSNYDEGDTRDAARTVAELADVDEDMAIVVHGRGGGGRAVAVAWVFDSLAA